jgi:NADH-quinone oxidoreductase subunit E
MLNDKEKAEIDHEVAKFPQAKNACLDALLVVQKHRRYISDETLRAIADYLNMSPTELDGIATFYNLIYRKPVGRSVIRLCDSVSCFIMGYERIYDAIKSYLGIEWGQTTTDHQFTLLKAQCLGCCDKACAMMINDELLVNLDKQQIPAILDAHKKGQSHAQATDPSHEKRRSATEPFGISSRTRL